MVSGSSLPNTCLYDPDYGPWGENYKLSDGTWYQCYNGSWQVRDVSKPIKSWVIKNLFEIKNAQRVLFEGNILENNWSHAQAGQAILFNGVDCSKSTIENITVRNNIISNAEKGVIYSANFGCMQLRPTNTISLENNLFVLKKVGGYSLDGLFAQIGMGIDNLTFKHNTIVTDGWTTYIGDGSSPLLNGFTFVDNIITSNSFNGGGTVEADHTISTLINTYIFRKNVFTGSYWTRFPYKDHSDNYSPTSVSQIGFENYAAKNYALAANSPYKNAASDGTDIGVNMSVLNSATYGVKTGVLSGSQPDPDPSPEPSVETPPVISSVESQNVKWASAIISWNTNEMASSKVEYAKTSSLGLVEQNNQLKTSHEILLKDLDPGTTYYYRVRSANASGSESVSEIKTFKTRSRLAKPPKPLNISARKGSVILEWDAVDYDLCQNIKIYRSTQNYVLTPIESSIIATIDCAETEFTDNNVSAGTYYYSLFVVDDLGVYSEPLLVQFLVEAESESSPSPVSSGGGGSSGSSSGRRNSTFPATYPSQSTSCSPTSASLGRNLAFRSEGEDVKILQNFLVGKGYTTADNITGFFGPITIEAVKRFQRDNSIVSSGDYLTTGYGMVGPVTRVRINALLGACSSSSTTLPSSQNNAVLQQQINALYAQVQALLLKLQQIR